MGKHVNLKSLSISGYHLMKYANPFLPQFHLAINDKHFFRYLVNLGKKTMAMGKKLTCSNGNLICDPGLNSMRIPQTLK